MKLFFRVTYVLFIFASLAFAGPTEELLKLPHRPTVSEIRAAFGGKLPKQNPFGTPSQDLQDTIKANAPVVIAAFEKAYPGATFAPLGRDAAFMGDIMDAFYQTLDQQRVVRVNASGASLGNDAYLIEYMERLGVNLANAPNVPPFVMFDQTNFANTSQSTRYFNVLFNACKAKNGNLKKFYEDFNFINTGNNRNMYNRNIITPQTDIYQFMESQKKHVERNTVPNAILSVNVEYALTYTSEYHDTFSKFRPLDDGTIQTTPGRLSSVSTRLQILADVFETMKAVSSPEFLAAVRQESLVLKYEFPLKRTLDPEERVKIRKQKISAEEYFAAMESLIRERLKTRIASQTSASAHWIAIKKDAEHYYQGTLLGQKLLMLRLAVVVDQAQQLDESTAKDILETTFPTETMDFEADLLTLKKAINDGLLMRKIFFSGEFSQHILDKGSATTWSNYMRVYGELKGISPEKVKEETLHLRLQTIRQKFDELLASNLAGEVLVQQIDAITTSLRRVMPKEGNQTRLNYYLQAYERNLIRNDHLVNLLKSLLDQSQSIAPQTQQVIIDTYNKSRFLRELFLGPLQVAARKDRELLASYQSVYLQVSGQSKEEFLASFFLDLPLSSEEVLYNEIQKRLLQIVKIDHWDGMKIVLKTLATHVKKERLSKEIFAKFILLSLVKEKMEPRFKSLLTETLASDQTLSQVWSESMPEVLKQSPWKHLEFEVRGIEGGSTSVADAHLTAESIASSIRFKIRRLVNEGVPSAKLESTLKTEALRLVRMDHFLGWALYFEITHQLMKSRHFDLRVGGDILLLYLTDVKKSKMDRKSVVEEFSRIMAMNPALKKVLLPEGINRLIQDGYYWNGVSSLYQDLYLKLGVQSTAAFAKEFIEKKFSYESKRGTIPLRIVEILIEVVVGAPPEVRVSLFLNALENILKSWDEKFLKGEQIALFISGTLPRLEGRSSGFDDEFIKVLKTNQNLRELWLKTIIADYNINREKFACFQQITVKWLGISSLEFERISIYSSFMDILNKDEQRAFSSLISQLEVLGSHFPSELERVVLIVDIVKNAYKENSLSKDQVEAFLTVFLAQVQLKTQEARQAFLTEMQSSEEFSEIWNERLNTRVVDREVYEGDWIKKYLSLNKEFNSEAYQTLVKKIVQSEKKAFLNLELISNYIYQLNRQDENFRSMFQRAEALGEDVATEIMTAVLNVANKENRKAQSSGVRRVRETTIEEMLWHYFPKVDLDRLSMNREDILGQTIIKNLDSQFHSPEYFHVRLNENEKTRLLEKFVDLQVDLTPEEFVKALKDLPQSRSRKKVKVPDISLNSRILKEYARQVIDGKNKTGLSREEFLKKYLETVSYAVEENKLKIEEVPELVSSIDRALLKSKKPLVSTVFANKPAILEVLAETARANSNRCLRVLQEKLID